MVSIWIRSWRTGFKSDDTNLARAKRIGALGLNTDVRFGAAAFHGDDAVRSTGVIAMIVWDEKGRFGLRFSAHYAQC